MIHGPLASALTIAEFRNSDKDISGTPGRQETEFKLPMLIDEDFSSSQLKKDIYQALLDLKNSKKFNFPTLTKSPYYLDKNFQAFAFKDYYFDDPNDTILKLKSAYRLRYRWAYKQAYLRHRLFPFVKAFDPTRCEIQFKYGYEDLGNGIISVKETRFEFRNQSEPFFDEQNAPQSPWPVDEYRGYVTSGEFKDWRILPMDALIKAIEINTKKINAKEIDTMEINALDTKEINIQEQFELITFRDRMHINMKHPWGSTVNSEQTFIITLDHSSLLNSRAPIKPEFQGKRLLEVEVEIERNSSTEMDRIIENSAATDPFIKPIVDQAVETSLLAKEYLNQDLNLIRTAIIAVFERYKEITPLPSDYKYSRFRSWQQKTKI